MIHQHRLKEIATKAAITIGFVALLYVAVATSVFRARHPWCTDMECLIYIGEALRYERVSYDEMRQRYE